MNNEAEIIPTPLSEHLDIAIECLQVPYNYYLDGERARRLDEDPWYQESIEVLQKCVLISKEDAVLFEQFKKGLDKRVAKHGHSPHHSILETVGICDLELAEVKDAVQQRHEKEIVKAELLDLAIAAFWGILSLNES